MLILATNNFYIFLYQDINFFPVIRTLNYHNVQASLPMLAADCLHREIRHRWAVVATIPHRITISTPSAMNYARRMTIFAIASSL